MLFSSLGVGGHRESVTSTQWKAIWCSILGLVLCSYYGPTAEAERAWWPLISHYYNPLWLLYLGTAYVIAAMVACVGGVPALSCLMPRKGSLAFTIFTAAIAGMLAGLMQTQLKVMAQGISSLGVSPKIACHHSPPGFCRHQVTSCPTLADGGGGWIDIICTSQTLVGRTIPAYPVSWLFSVNGWLMAPTAILQLSTMNTAIASNDMAIAMPLYSSAVLIFTIVSGSIYFNEASQMGHLSLFLLGTAITLASLVVLARGKALSEKKDQERREAIAKAECDDDNSEASVEAMQLVPLNVEV